MKCPACGKEFDRKKEDITRSYKQNKYLHGIVIPLLSEHFDYGEYETKVFIKLWYRIKHTSDLTTKQFDDWLKLLRKDVATPDSEINRHFRTSGIYIPEPKEQLQEA